MTPAAERYARVQAVFDAAAELSPGDRAGLLMKNVAITLRCAPK
jgi:hypothetical protein